MDSLCLLFGFCMWSPIKYIFLYYTLSGQCTSGLGLAFTTLKRCSCIYYKHSVMYLSHTGRGLLIALERHSHSHIGHHNIQALLLSFALHSHHTLLVFYILSHNNRWCTSIKHTSRHRFWAIFIELTRHTLRWSRAHSSFGTLESTKYTQYYG